jgi:uncharacterized protein (TIGR03435 family)
MDHTTCRLNFARLLLALAAIAGASGLRMDGQTPEATPSAPPAFEVASIKPVAPPIPTGGGPWTMTHGRFRAEVANIRDVIGWAYNVLLSQVKGGPDWIDSDPYYFDARADNSDAGPEQIRVMLRTLLTDRFKLAVHRETQTAQAYTLTVGKNGSKLQDAKDGRKGLINWTGPGQVTFTENPGLEGGLIGILSFLLSAPVLDETGLKGSYNFSLDFTNPRDPRPRQADSPPDLFTAVQEQLGLKLEAKKGPVEVVVIDHMERPTAN